MKRPTALVCGAGGFIGTHLVRRLKSEGYYVRGVDLKMPRWSPTEADDFQILDLRDPDACRSAVNTHTAVPFDEVYQLAADMGGMGYIENAAGRIMLDNVRINANMLDAALWWMGGCERYFFSSSVCVYRDMFYGESPLREQDAVPANPHNEYGWEKLYSERMAVAAGDWSDRTRVKIARFQNCYGPEGTWVGGREKAPAAICRKIAEVEKVGGEIEIWGDGLAVRGYTYIDDMVAGVRALMSSDLDGPVNLGAEEKIAVMDLVRMVADIADKTVWVKRVPGPVGVRYRDFSKARIHSVGWSEEIPLREGLTRTYRWVSEQIQRSRRDNA